FTVGYWEYIPRSNPTVPKPNDDITPSQLGLSGNVFTQEDYDRGDTSNPDSPFYYWQYNFTSAYRPDGSVRAVKYGPNGEFSVSAPSLTDAQVRDETRSGLKQIVVGGLSTIVDASRDLTPVFIIDRGSALVMGSSPYRGGSDQISRGQAATELAVVAISVGLLRQIGRAIDEQASSATGFGRSGGASPAAGGSSAAKAGDDLFHGTTAPAGESVRSGLSVGGQLRHAAKRNGIPDPDGSGFYMTYDRVTAEQYARLAAAEQGASPVIIRIPKKDIEPYANSIDKGAGEEVFIIPKDYRRINTENFTIEPIEAAPAIQDVDLWRGHNFGGG
ncbi:MAG: hypothetical protein PF961_07100, partial [Planctomycetota bacterium]|nr:hypothetical protein [Planctomycetota bacterium]